MTDIELAEIVCIVAHKSIGQVRKYTGVPYHTHPFSVADRVSQVTGSKNTIIAALLHDVVEDTELDLKDIEAIFGPNVTSLVEQVTDVSKPEDGNRAVRKKIDRAHISKASPEAKTIKLADLIDNTEFIYEHDPKFAKVYMEEKRKLLEVLHEGDQRLFKKAKGIVDNYFQGNH